MITLDQYFSRHLTDGLMTPDMRRNASVLLAAVNALLHEAAVQGAYDFPVNPFTGTNISGSKGGSGDGGFRAADSTTGAAKSQHKQANAVDVYDPVQKLDNWLKDATLTLFGLYREHPSATPTWCHLQRIGPPSGRRTFYP